MQGKGTNLAEEEIAPGVTGHLSTERREVSKACHCVFTASYCSERRKASSGGGGGREEGRREVVRRREAAGPRAALEAIDIQTRLVWVSAVHSTLGVIQDKCKGVREEARREHDDETATATTTTTTTTGRVQRGRK